MKLLLITENWYPPVGGIENYLWHVAQYLVKEGHEVTVVAPPAVKARGAGERQREGQGDGARKAMGADGREGMRLGGVNEVKIIRRKFFGRLIRPRWWWLYRWLKKKIKAEKYEMILVGKGLFEGLMGGWLKKRLSIPLGVFSYGMEIETWRQRWWEKQKLQWVAQTADIIYCINEPTRKAWQGLGADERKIVKAWPGIDDQLFGPRVEEEIMMTLKKYDLKQPYIISVGRLIERKGFDVLIEAFAKLDQTRFSDTQLVIVGDGPELTGLQNMVEKELIDSSVLFLPDVPDEDLPALYAGAVLFALTPKEIAGDVEGFGMVYLEAAARGTPAVGTRTGGVPEAVIDGGTGIIVAADNVRAVTKAMEKLLSDQALRAKLGECAARRASADFRWEKRIRVIAEGLKQTATSES